MSDEDNNGNEQRDSGDGLKPLEAARRAGDQLAELRGRDLDGIAGVDRHEDGWRVLVDLVEVSRVPRATDVLATYEVLLDGDGDLVACERLRRYVRAQAGEDEL